MQNPFDDRVLALSGPARDYLPVTPSDADPLPQVAVGLYVEVGGRVVAGDGELDRYAEVARFR